MKFSFFVAAAATLIYASEARAALRHTVRTLKADGAAHKSREENPCPGGAPNRFPSGLEPSYTIVGKNKLDAIWDTEKLREALAKEEQWKIGQPWFLKATFTNNGAVSRTFGFQAGEDKGFLELVVPAGCVDCVVEMQSAVLSSGQHAEFQYRDEKPFTSGEVTMSNICLTPQVCKGFECPHPLTQKLKGDDTFGWSEAACCEPRYCKDEITCSPTTQWEPRKDFDTRMGSTPQGCCTARLCPSDFCDNIPGWEKHSATGLKGSTKEECCIQKECMDWTCSSVTIMTKKAVTFVDQLTGKNVTRKGFSDVECCEEHHCSEFQIPDAMKTMWKLKENAAELRGVELKDCCDPILCNDFSCPNNTKFRPKNATKLAGSTEDECCEALFCNAYECSDTAKLQKKVKPEERRGSTDEECCEEKFCKDYKCSDPTKWIHFSDQRGPTNIDRRGSSDEECCEPLFCRPEICNPSTMWKQKEGLDKLQGSTMAQCCEPIYCGNFTCDTDDDGDGEGTMWYKKKDTNVYKWQGSTNEECCVPKYCSQYTTATPTQWKRKPQKNAQGSTDVECYDQLWCSEYCCVGAGWVRKPEAGTRPGSTDAECCTPGSEAEELPDMHKEKAR